ncbi:glycosyltransferase family 4 protein [Kineosporia sp. A_224]|uniref:glycosyltransferase family 4 protein n=1 Tax=Kineosporia sp. A_224 TaxID=1962180 RepID=UPI001303F575|nr:glycosyltransferase family 4 protein [Kineosporia sp. A_224]
MRVVHVTDTYLPRLGGIELHVHDLAERQRRLGHDVVVLTGTRPGARGRDRADDLPVVRIGRAGWAALPLAALAALDAADVVHCHSSIVSPLAWTTARRSAAAGVPVVVTMHSVVQRSAVVTTGLRAVAHLAGPTVVWSAVSEVAAKALAPCVPQGVEVMPNGVDPAAWPALPARERRPGEPLTVLSVGRLAARKRVLPLVDVLAEVRRRLDPQVPLRAVIAGDGPQRDAVRQRVRALGMSGWVELPGRLTREQVRALHAVSDVYVAPARLESFGLAALEARCSGLPVVALAAAGVGEFVTDGVEGRLVADDAGLAAATADLLADPAALAAVRAHNAGTPTGLGWDDVVRGCLETYGAAVVAAARRPVAGTLPQGILGVS